MQSRNPRALEPGVYPTILEAQAADDLIRFGFDARSAEVTDSRDLPWYVTTLLVSQPLHFGDYGGMPMQIIWALLDLVTIVVLGSGLYLWLARRRSPAGATAVGAHAANGGMRTAR